jgi:hypothetical protein
MEMRSPCRSPYMCVHPLYRPLDASTRTCVYYTGVACGCGVSDDRVCFWLHLWVFAALLYGQAVLSGTDLNSVPSMPCPFPVGSACTVGRLHSVWLY